MAARFLRAVRIVGLYRENIAIAFAKKPISRVNSARQQQQVDDGWERASELVHGRALATGAAGSNGRCAGEVLTELRSWTART